MLRTAKITIQRWGDSLAVRIPAAVARAARFEAGLEVEVSSAERVGTVRPVVPRRLMLEEKLAQFDPSLHGGEAMTGGGVSPNAS